MLNAREEKFVAALVAGDSQRAAYRKAFKQSRKWKDATVDTKACLLWKQDKIQERYFEVREEVARAAHDEGIVTAKDILRELAKIGFADITDYLTVKSDLVQIKNTEDIPRARIGAISAIKQGNFGIEMKLHDKVRALELMARIYGLVNGQPMQQADDNGLSEAIGNAAKEIFADEVLDVQQKTTEDTDVVGASDSKTEL
ncbi:hypothetical protein DWV16_17150 [Anaerotruncus sp. AF02-27]|uniref:terminase small subunit n=1 Tax=Anaerotruncus TaxID=244127 RepID=UPI000E500CE1|nr:terminase small subunit [Anaerotruncus sp. AF02-27]RGX53178.1 hypothetical protein DWV16_17150 [Anaerotruncus sp. AF02-27]